MIDQLLATPPYALAKEQKSALFLPAMQAAYLHHFNACEGFRKYCTRRGFGEQATFGGLADFPFLPVAAFKEFGRQLSSVDSSELHRVLQSSATSGIPSTVVIDKVTAKRQVRALASVLAQVLGPKRRPFLIVDVDPSFANPQALGARAAAVRGFLNLASESRYCLESDQNGKLALNSGDFERAIGDICKQNEPTVLLGFTYVLFQSLMTELDASGRHFTLPPGSKIVHIGGWKKLEDKKISKAEFNRLGAKLFGISQEDVIDFYGFTEQMGVTYPDDEDGNKCVPVFAEVLVRDPNTYALVPDGQVGQLQFLTPLPHSYPGISVLTDDLGMIVPSCNSQWEGTRFKIVGRAKKAEARGCGDIMADKMAASLASQTAPVEEDIRLLADGQKTYSNFDPTKPVDLKLLPKVENIQTLMASLKSERAKLDKYSIDELIALVAAAAKKWIEPESLLISLKQQGLLFLSQWCSAASLRLIADQSLKERGFLDTFRATDGNNRRMMRAFERGLVTHWLAGNVPLLGMLALVQSILTRNANVLKVASSFSTVMPGLLDAFRDLEIKMPYGKTLFGNDILASIAVVYFSRDDKISAEKISADSDIRLAWGGREAVETIVNLPKRHTTDDIVYGPKLSFMAVGKEFLSSKRELDKLVRKIATDISVFDQYACASPHTIFVERGGELATPKELAALVAAEMDRAAIRIPKTPADWGTATKIAGARIRYEFCGDLWASNDTTWTVLYDENGHEGLVSPTYSRVATVRAIDNILDAANFATKDTQTIGLALNGRRKLEFAERAAKNGADRFPEIGRMTFFDAPWDGFFLMDRLVRWVSLGGPM